MNKVKKVIAAILRISLATVVAIILANCSDENINPAEAVSTEVASGLTEVPSLTTSLTITGIYTTVEDATKCASCTFIVPTDRLVIDGRELDIKPGSVICLDAARHYGNLEFINLEGTLEKPILITTTSLQ
ncbi:MAG: hypothetical protein ACOYXT_15790 [Bacteroidota bacterium]